MIDPNEPVYVESLPGGLTLRTATVDDVERLAAFNGLLHGPEIIGMTRRLLLEHPHVTGRDFIFIEDKALIEDAAGAVISSLCLIPWMWSYAGAPLPVGEMGIVGTLEGYRNRGLIRAQTPFFRQRLAERGCLLSIIQGIPYFYRQFGYEYALPLEATISLELRQAPAMPATDDGRPAFTFRRATADDAALLARLYNVATGGVTIHATRDPSTWHYLLTPYDAPDAMSHQTWLIEDGAAVAGYFRVAEFHFHSELTIDEASALPFGAGLATLAFCRELAVQRNEPGIRLNLPADHGLSRLALAQGGHDRGAYSWQLMIPDVPALLRGIAPTLECRLAASMFAGLTRELRVSFFREGFTMRFEGGRVVEVTDMTRGMTGWDASMPERAFTPLVFGWRSLEQLHETYPDLGAWGVNRLLLETLFPPCRAWINTVY